MHSEAKPGKQAKLYLVSGMVQGVGFRYFARRVSQRLGLTGYVKNLRDGRVEVYAIGPAGQLAELRKELARGPQAASVSDVMEEEAGVDEKFGREFSIEHETW